MFTCPGRQKNLAQPLTEKGADLHYNSRENFNSAPGIYNTTLVPSSLRFMRSLVAYAPRQLLLGRPYQVRRDWRGV